MALFNFHRGDMRHSPSLWFRHSTLLSRKRGQDGELKPAWTGYNVWPIRKLWGLSVGRLTLSLMLRGSPKYERLPKYGPEWDAPVPKPSRDRKRG